MKIEYWSYQNVLPNGTIKGELGEIDPIPKINTSGLHHAQTRSTVESGLWMSVSTGRLEDSSMHGITIYFSNESEMDL
jgi:hypothetical protein